MNMRSHSAIPLGTILKQAIRRPGRVLSKILQILSRPFLAIATIRPFATRSRWLRECVFNAAHGSGKIDLVCVENAGERMLASCRDNVIGRRLFVDGQFDFEKFELALDLLKSHGKLEGEVDLLVDVGANIGSICIPSIMRGFVKRALAIEPDPSNARILRANIALNGLESSIDMRQLAVGAREDESLMLELSETNWGDHRISVSEADGRYGESARRRISIRSTTLDSLFAPVPGETTLVWMDTQGYEGRVLEGAKNSILSPRTPMVVEFWPYGLTRAGGVEEFSAAISHYEHFLDLDHPEQFHVHGDLDTLFRRLHAAGGFTDLLLF